MLQRNQMVNQAMKRKLDSGDALDISTYPRTAEGDYVLTDAVGYQAEHGDTDLCDARLETWVWSVGKSQADGYVTMADGTQRMLPGGTYVASPSAKFYQAENLGWRCVWLR